MEKLVMVELTSLDQLKIGTRIQIIAKCDKYSEITSVKNLIPMRQFKNGKWSKVYDTEILTNRRRNHYFSFSRYIKGKSNWVKKVYVLEGIDKRLKRKW